MKTFPASTFVAYPASKFLFHLAVRGEPRENAKERQSREGLLLSCRARAKVCARLYTIFLKRRACSQASTFVLEFSYKFCPSALSIMSSLSTETFEENGLITARRKILSRG